VIQLDAHNDFDSQNKDREPLVKTPPDLNAIFSGIQLQNIVPQQDILKAQSKLTLIAKLELTLVQVLDYIFEKLVGHQLPAVPLKAPRFKAKEGQRA
jgi:hypothetical protein